MPGETVPVLGVHSDTQSMTAVATDEHTQTIVSERAGNSVRVSNKHVTTTMWMQATVATEDSETCLMDHCEAAEHVGTNVHYE